MSLNEIKTISFSDFKKEMNALRCPLCSSQLDGNINIHGADLYCVSNNSEYNTSYAIDYGLTHESVRHYFFPWEYTISNHLMNTGSYKSYIIKYNMEVSLITKDATKKVLLEHNGSKIETFNKKMTEEEFYKKLKTYLMFS